ncbi:MAG: cellulase family glycosylhydrolase [Acidimicrobiales bacterium]|nr:cellulase family glycosylhydrolase [Acidimicrobiales bacterium]
MGARYTTRDGWFIDEHGRYTLLRGVNFGGSSKVPYRPDGATHLGVDFEHWRDVSFIGRPAPLDEIDRHLDRISHWGFNVLRLLVTWEAIEHAGPGEYDEPYLEYVREVVRRAGKRGLLVFIDPHHDVWSRWTGGDGAPFWCFELAGLRPDLFVPSGAVSLHDIDWPSAYNRVPVATMWTLFFAGDRYCPRLAGVQEQLQSCFLGALRAVAERVAEFENVLGYDTLNEPSYGYLGRSSDLYQRTRIFATHAEPQKPFSAIEFLAAADGHTISHDDGGILNPDGLSIWESGCPWRDAGVWEIGSDGKPMLTNERYFLDFDRRPLRPFTDVVVPFINRVRDTVREIHPDCLLFIEGSPTDFDLEWDDPDPLVVNARHWYDITILGLRRFDPADYTSLWSGKRISGVDELADEYAAMFEVLDQHSRQKMSGAPLLFGEFGITFDMNDGEAFRTGDYSKHAVALEATYRAMDRYFIHGTQWNYTADNDHAHGDQWNHEDLSVFSVDDIPADADPMDLDAGGRAVVGFCRPRVVHAAGRPTRSEFDPHTGSYLLELDADPTLGLPTEVYVPRLHFPDAESVEIQVDDGEATLDLDAQRLLWRHHVAGTVGLRLVRRC